MFLLLELVVPLDALAFVGDLDLDCNLVSSLGVFFSRLVLPDTFTEHCFTFFEAFWIGVLSYSLLSDLSTFIS